MKTDDVVTLTGEKDASPSDKFSRRRFIGTAALAAAGAALAPRLLAQEKVQDEKPPAAAPSQIKTNIDEVRGIPRVKGSMPGKYPGKVVRVATGKNPVGQKIDGARVRREIERGMAELTGEKKMGKAWRQFAGPKDVVGIKVNPIGGAILSTKPEVVDVIVAGLLAAGVRKANIVIWDRRHFQLGDAGFTEARFPGIRIEGTEMRGPNGEFYDDKGELWARDNVDREALPYVADLEMKYNKELLGYMINEGKESYFTRIVTEKVTKIVNVPILKNSGATATCCLKNLAYGSISNTSRLHKIWMNSVAEPCAFPVLRDKVVLNVVDGLQACYDGGPGANPKFIYDANVLLLGTDPVAVDAVAHDILVKERMARGVQQTDSPRQSAFLEIAAGLGLGVAARDKIKISDVALG
ncbi:MAG TPA: DUF362 domain-containing protein [Acidobacteriota bacterium]|nr:DUF362 domain-containing protein [Acidobacteriota bacterium]